MVNITKDSSEQMGGKQAEWLIEHSKIITSRFGYENIMIDGVGVGVGVIDGGKDRG